LISANNRIIVVDKQKILLELASGNVECILRSQNKIEGFKVEENSGVITLQ
jgi:hypothetical protein